MITAAWDVPLPAHARLVLIALADSASDDEGVCWISNKTIMEKSTCAKTTLGYILFAFEKLGIILRETRFRPENGSQTSSLKRVVIPVFSGSKKEIEGAKVKFKAEYETAYISARLKKDTPSHHVTGGEGSQGDLPHITLVDLPPVTQCDPLYEPSVEPSFLKEDNTPHNPPLREGRKKSSKKSLNLSQIADLHEYTVSTVWDFVKFRKNSGGVESPDAFEKWLLKELCSPYSSESKKLDLWFEAWGSEREAIEILFSEFLSISSLYFNRRGCRERGRDSFSIGWIRLKGFYEDIPEKDSQLEEIIVEIAYQLAETAKKQCLGGAA